MRHRLLLAAAIALLPAPFLAAADVAIPDIAFQKYVLDERPHAGRARGPQGPDRGRERLVPRRLEEREGGQDRLRPPLRAPDVQRQRELQRRLLQGAGEDRRDRPQRHDQRGPHELLPERAGDGARHRAVDGVRPHGPPPRRHRPEEARRAARRRAEREAAGRERAVRPGRGADPDRRLPQGPPVLVDGHRLDGGPQRRLARRREGVVQDVLRPVERGARRGRRREGGGREGPGREVLRRHPAGSADREARGLDREEDGRAAPGARGPRAPGPDLQGLEHAAVGHARRRLPVRCSRTCSPRARARASTSGSCTTTRSRPTSPRSRTRSEIGGAFVVAGDREAGRRPRRGREGARRGDGAVAEGRADRRGDRAGEDREAGGIRPRRREDRRLRRQVGRPRAEPGLGRPAGLLPRAARAREGGDAGRGRRRRHGAGCRTASTRSRSTRSPSSRPGRSAPTARSARSRARRRRAGCRRSSARRCRPA